MASCHTPWLLVANGNFHPRPWPQESGWTKLLISICPWGIYHNVHSGYLTWDIYRFVLLIHIKKNAVGQYWLMSVDNPQYWMTLGDTYQNDHGLGEHAALRVAGWLPKVKPVIGNGGATLVGQQPDSLSIYYINIFKK